MAATFHATSSPPPCYNPHPAPRPLACFPPSLLPAAQAPAMAAAPSLNAGAEHYLTGWLNSNQLDDLSLWNGLAGEEESGQEAMMYGDGIASVLITGFEPASERRSHASAASGPSPAEDDEYLGLLGPEDFPSEPANMDAYISDPVSEDGLSPASDLIDADVLRLAPADAAERESSNGYAYAEFSQHEKTTNPLPPSSFFPFMESCPKQPRFNNQWQSGAETSIVMKNSADSPYIQSGMRQAVQMGGGGKANHGQRLHSLHRRTEGPGVNSSFFKQCPSVPSGYPQHPDPVYQPHQLRMQRQMAAKYHDPRSRTKTQGTQCGISNNSPVQSHRKRQIGMDLNHQKYDHSLEARVLRQLESSIKNMSMANRYIIRDSFYRLATGAKERQVEAYGNAAARYPSPPPHSRETAFQEKVCRVSRAADAEFCSGVSFGAPEIETNSFDRWMVNLLFQRKGCALPQA